MDAYELRAQELEKMLTRIPVEGGSLNETAEQQMMTVCDWIEAYRRMSKTYTRVILI